MTQEKNDAMREQRLAEIRERLQAAARDQWDIMRDGPNGDGEPWTAHREAAPGLTIGSHDHTEPLARVSGYLRNAKANAALIANAPSDIAFLLEQLPIEQVDAGYDDVEREAMVRERAQAGYAAHAGDVRFLASVIDDLRAQLDAARVDAKRLDAYERYALENHGDGEFSTQVADVEGQPPCGCEDAECGCDLSGEGIEWSVAGPRLGAGYFAVGRGANLRAAIDDAISEDPAMSAAALPRETEVPTNG